MRNYAIAVMILVFTAATCWSATLSSIRITPGDFYIRTALGAEKAKIAKDGSMRLNTNKFTVSTGGNVTIAGNLSVAGTTTFTSPISFNSGIAVNTDKFTVNGSTGQTTIKPSTTTTTALTVNGTSITSGDVLNIRGTSGLGTSGYYIRVVEDTTPVLTVKRAGSNSVTAAITGSLSATGVISSPVIDTAASASNALTLSSSHYGKTIFYTPTASAAVTLPANNAPAGSVIRVVVLADQTVTFSPATDNTLVTKGSTIAASVSFSTASEKIGSSIMFIATGSAWTAINEGDTTMTVTIAGG